MRVKICGITNAEVYAAAATADWVGFVFFPPSPRFVTPAQAAAIAQPGGPRPVGLFVDPTDAAIVEALDAIPLAVLQLVATPERVADIRQRFGLPVWRAVGMATASDLPSTLDGADALLLDTKAPPEARTPGGNAAAFDWSILHGWTAPGPWILAGGLTPENVGEAIATTGATAVDVSSGVETARGVKSPALIADFIRAAASGPSPAKRREREQPGAS